jgi:hypothetical protein
VAFTQGIDQQIRVAVASNSDFEKDRKSSMEENQL